MDFIILSSIVEFLDVLPLWSIISGIAVILTTVGGIVTNGEKIIKFIRRFKINKRKKFENLKKHILFKRIDDTLSYDKIAAKTTVRNEIAIILKDIKLNTYREKILILLDSKLSTYSKDDLIKKCKDLLFEYVDESNKQFKKQSHNKEEEKTADIILNKFKTYENDQIKTAISVIDDISNDTTVKNNIDIMDNILTAYQFLINNIISTTTETVNRLNGELAGREFLGKKIEKHDEKI